MADRSPVRTILLILMDLLVALALFLVVRLVVLFFGVLAVTAWAKAIAKLSQPFVLPFGVKAISTPYGGIFDINAALSIAAYLVIEWAVSIARRAS